jgi:hypothetical protein
MMGWKADAACKDRMDLDWLADVPSAECEQVVQGAR